MSRHKIHPDMPSGLTYKERYHYLKSHGLCVSCGINDAIDSVFCDICRIKNLDNTHRHYEKCRIKREQQSAERKSIQQKQDYFDFCIEQANKLKISYGEYMALKHEGRV